MARPPKNAEGPSATERMESAFWDCMKEMPFSEITVRDIVSRAKVNRNSYYYHYDSMWKLAETSVRHANFAALARVLLGDSPAADPADEATAAGQARSGFEHLRILAGENGNQRLLEDAKDAVTDAWLDLFGLREGELADERRSSIDFVFGGLTALLAAGQPGDLDAFVTTVGSSPLLGNTIIMLRDELDPESPGKTVGSQGFHGTMVEGRVIVERTVEELVVSEKEVEEILTEAKNAPVNEVLAAPEETSEPPAKPAYEPVIEEVSAASTNEGYEEAKIDDAPEPTSNDEKLASKQVPSKDSGGFQSKQTEDDEDIEPAPFEYGETEIFTAHVLDKKTHIEEFSEESPEQGKASTQVPERQMQTQQETEHNHEAISEQEPVDEAQSQEDFAPAQDIDDVPAAEEKQEGKSVVDLEQEAAENHESEALPSWETEDDEPIGVVSAASEFVSEQVAESLAVHEATRAEVPAKSSDGSADDALNESKAPVKKTYNAAAPSQIKPAAGPEVATKATEDPDEESQLSFDFLL